MTAPTTKLPRDDEVAERDESPRPASAVQQDEPGGEMFSASRNSVVISSSVGKTDELQRRWHVERDEQQHHRRC